MPLPPTTTPAATLMHRWNGEQDPSVPGRWYSLPTTHIGTTASPARRRYSAVLWAVHNSRGPETRHSGCSVPVSSREGRRDPGACSCTRSCPQPTPPPPHKPRRARRTSATTTAVQTNAPLYPSTTTAQTVTTSHCATVHTSRSLATPFLSLRRRGRIHTTRPFTTPSRRAPTSPPPPPPEGDRGNKQLSIIHAAGSSTLRHPTCTPPVSLPFRVRRITDYAPRQPA